LQLEGERGITGYTWENVTITPDYSDDPDMSALLERYSTQ